VGLKYGRLWAVALTAGLILSMVGAGSTMAGDDAVFDGVVTVHWVDPDDGPIAGATIQILYYHAPDEIPANLPGTFTLDAAGDAVITGVPRSAEGADPILLDVRGDMATSSVDDKGCTTLMSWIAETRGIPSALEVDVILDTESRGMNIECPEPTPTPDGEPTPSPTATPDPEPTPTPDETPTATPPTATAPTDPSGGVLGATGRPQVTPPATDAVIGAAAPARSPFVPVLLALITLAALLVPVASRSLARPRSGDRRRR
jgi:hypothetical protein